MRVIVLGHIRDLCLWIRLWERHAIGTSYCLPAAKWCSSKCWVPPKSTPLLQLSMAQHLSQSWTKHEWLADPTQGCLIPQGQGIKGRLQSHVTAVLPSPRLSDILHDRRCWKMEIRAICLACDLLPVLCPSSSGHCLAGDRRLTRSCFLPWGKVLNEELHIKTLPLTCRLATASQPHSTTWWACRQVPCPSRKISNAICHHREVHSCTSTSHSSLRTFGFHIAFFFFPEEKRIKVKFIIPDGSYKLQTVGDCGHFECRQKASGVSSWSKDRELNLYRTISRGMVII